MTNKVLRVAVIGAGDMGVRHLRGWQNAGTEIVAVVDDVPSRLEALGATLQPSTRFYNDYKTAISEARPNVVSVCIPTAFHAPVSLYAIEHGAHVLCEKPIALTLEDADAMIEAAKRQGVLLTVGFMLRYSSGIAKLKDWVSSGAIGKPILATSENFMEVRPKVLMHAKNVNGGPILDYWCHQFDLWSFLFDSEPVSVSGYGTIFAQGKPEVANLGELAIDTAGVTIKYKSGDIAQFSTTWGLPRTLKGRDISGDKLIGPKGMIIGDIRKQMTLVNGAGQTEEVNNTGVDWWQLEIAALAENIRNGGAPLVDARNGREALRLSLAALKAIETGQTITL
jgi:predicted dehydrogenase